MSTSLVTGATAGIGHEYAVQLAARGDDLVLVARDSARLEEVADELRRAHQVEVEVLVADLVDRDDLARVEARLADRDRPVDLLVNNAGFGLKQRFLDNSADDETAMLEVLVTAVLRLSHAALGAMAERGHGGIINVSSVAAFLPRGTYSAAKAWVNSFSEWAHLEYRSRGVRVMALCPGFTKTEFHQRMHVKRGDGFMWLDADFLVRTSLEDFEKGRAYSVPGAQYKAIRVLTTAIPNRVLRLTQSMGRRVSGAPSPGRSDGSGNHGGLLRLARGQALLRLEQALLLGALGRLRVVALLLRLGERAPGLRLLLAGLGLLHGLPDLRDAVLLAGEHRGDPRERVLRLVDLRLLLGAGSGLGGLIGGRWASDRSAEGKDCGDGESAGASGDRHAEFLLVAV